MTSRSDATTPLAGIRVVEISSFVAVPLAGMTLSQLGCESFASTPWAERRLLPMAIGGGWSQHLLGRFEQGQTICGRGHAHARGAAACSAAHR
jgi:hypothetical protein